MSNWHGAGMRERSLLEPSVQSRHWEVNIALGMFLHITTMYMLCRQARWASFQAFEIDVQLNDMLCKQCAKIDLDHQVSHHSVDANPMLGWAVVISTTVYLQSCLNIKFDAVNEQVRRQCLTSGSFSCFAIAVTIKVYRTHGCGVSLLYMQQAAIPGAIILWWPWYYCLCHTVSHR